MCKIDLNYIERYNEKLGWGYYFKYPVFIKNIEPYLEEVIGVIKNDFISVIKYGEINFCHYGVPVVLLK